jgi:hypothetical protein
MHGFCKRFTFLSLIFCITFIYAQPPDTLWTKTYGGTSDDVGLAAQYTSDGYSTYILELESAELK